MIAAQLTILVQVFWQSTEYIWLQKQVIEYKIQNIIQEIIYIVILMLLSSYLCDDSTNNNNVED